MEDDKLITLHISLNSNVNLIQTEFSSVYLFVSAQQKYRTFINKYTQTALFVNLLFLRITL